MRVVTTCHKEGFTEYGWRWLESRKFWPFGTDFQFYTEGYEADCPGKDMLDLRDFTEWRKLYAHYVPPSWRYDIVKFAHKVFAVNDALRDYDGVGVWLDADCVTYKKIPKGMIEDQVKDAYIALYQRTGHYSETGLWIVNCAHSAHKDFFGWWLHEMYWNGNFTRLPEWHDCTTLDTTIKRFVAKGLITVKNLSGEHAREMHPQAKSALGKYIDHCKGKRKVKGYSQENKGHAVRVSA